LEGLSVRFFPFREVRRRAWNGAVDFQQAFVIYHAFRLRYQAIVVPPQKEFWQSCSP